MYSYLKKSLFLLFFLKICFLFLDCSSISAKSTTEHSFESLIEKGKLGKSGIFVQDTIKEEFIRVKKETHKQGFYEIWWENSNSVYILQHQIITHNLDGKVYIEGISRLCKYDDAASAIAYFDYLSNYYKSSFHSYVHTSKSLNGENCVEKSTLQLIESKTPLIKKMLAGEFVIASIFEKELKASSTPEFTIKDNKLLIDLTINLPSQYQFQRIAYTELNQVSNESGDLIYPPSNIPEWKNKLIQSECFAQGVVNNVNLPVTAINRKNSISTQEISSKQIKATIQLFPERRDFGKVFSTKGNLFVKVFNDAPPFKEVKALDFNGNTNVQAMGDVKLKMHYNNTLVYKKDNDWVEMNFRDKSGLAKFNIKKGEYKNFSITAADKIADLEIIYRESEIIKIPFGNLISENNKTKTSSSQISKPVFVDCQISPTRSVANFKLPLNPGETIESVENLKITDGKGQSLLQFKTDLNYKVKINGKHPPSTAEEKEVQRKNWIKRSFLFRPDKYSEYDNSYSLEISIFIPLKDIDQILISSDINVKDAKGNLKSLSFDESVSINNKNSAPTKNRDAYSLENTIKPSHLKLGSNYRKISQGIRAHYELMSGDQPIVYSIDKQKSKILSIKDNIGLDLTNTAFFSSSQNQFSIHLSEMLKYPATKAFAEIDVVYLAYDPNSIKKKVQKVNVSNKQLIFEFENTKLFYEASSRKVSGLKNVRYFKYDFRGDDVIPIKQVYVKDKTGTIVWEEKYDGKRPSKILIPQNNNSEFTIEFEYYPTKELKKKINVEISMDTSK